MKKIKLFILLATLLFALFNQSFAKRRTPSIYKCFGVLNKTSIWPGTWKLTLMDLDCYYMTAYSCEPGENECTVCIDSSAPVNIISDDGCIITIEVSWSDLITLRRGVFVYDTY